MTQGRFAEMPCNYRIYKERRLVFSRAWGELTYAEGVAHEDGLYAEPDFDPTFSHLIDASGLEKADIAATELASLARRKRFSPQARMALVVTSNVFFGLARMFQSFLQISGSGEHMRVFRELDEAKEWLKIDFEI